MTEHYGNRTECVARLQAKNETIAELEAENERLRGMVRNIWGQAKYLTTCSYCGTNLNTYIHKGDCELGKVINQKSKDMKKGK